MNIISGNETKNNSGDRRTVTWAALRQELPGQYGAARGYCEGCRLFLWSDGALKIPGVRGLFCSVLCLECTLFGFGRCRQCGDPLQRSTGQRFCGDSCRKKPLPKHFGDGTQLLAYLSHCHFALYDQLMSGRNVGSCLNCNGRIEEKRSDSKYCSDACKVAYSRKSRTAGKAGNNRNNVLQTQVLREGVLTAPYLPPTQARKAVEIAEVSV